VLAIALGVENRVAERDKTLKVARKDGLARAKGEAPATRDVAKELGKSWNVAADRQGDMAYWATRDFWMGVESGNFKWPVPHPSDPWFAGATKDEQFRMADRVAQWLIDEMRAGMLDGANSKRAARPPEPLRWAIYNLLEGCIRRHRVPSEVMRFAVYEALGLIDEKGSLRRVPLGGIEDHEGFMAALREEARRDGEAANARLVGCWIAGTVRNQPDEKRIREWRKMPLYGVGLDLHREARQVA
jgi:hypothetical protein